MTKRQIVVAGLWALSSVVLLVVAAAAFALYFLHRFNPSPPANDFPAPDALAAQQQDIEQFSRLLGMDRSFSPIARAEANRQIAALRAERAPLDFGKFRVALMRITALADNGHTELNDEGRRPDYVPVRVTYGGMTRWLSPARMTGEPPDWRALFSSDADLPLPLRDFDSAFRRTWITHGCTLFVQLKAISDVDGQHIGDFLKGTTDEMHRYPPCNIILDMRFNTGGDYTTAAGFASHLAEFLPPGGRIYILSGPQTFSAAITTMAFVKQAAGARAVILGEPVGDRLAFYGEGNTGCLPHSGLCIHYATGMHDYAKPCTDWGKCFWLNWLFPVQVKSLALDETIAMTYGDYLARRHPVFDRAVALATARE